MLDVGKEDERFDSPPSRQVIMIPFAIALLQTSAVPLTPFTDDGATKTHEVPPIFVPIARTGGRNVATIRVGTIPYRVLVSDTAGQRALFVDRNRNGRFEANERTGLAVQKTQLPDGQTLFIFSGAISLPGGTQYFTQSFLSKTNSADYLRAKGKLFLRPMSGFVGTATFSGKKMRIGIRGSDPATASLFIDRDGDGKLGTVRAELYNLDQPFNLNGRSYRMAAFDPSGKPSIRFVPSSKVVAEVPMPADLRVGKVVPSITGTTLAGRSIQFPKSFAGKVVMLDVWATWCGPCIGEIPFMKASYSKFRNRGFEIVSFSIDDPGMRDQVAAFTREKGTNWTQVFQGRGWESPVIKAFNITGIPFMLLVDGSTGKILATPDRLRGNAMAQTIEGVLAMRGR